MAISAERQADQRGRVAAVASGFVWSDQACYAVGVGIGLLDHTTRSSSSSQTVLRFGMADITLTRSWAWASMRSERSEEMS